MSILRAPLLLAAALSAAACTGRAPGPPPAVDCALADAYEFKSTGQTFELATDTDAAWYSFGDCTRGSANSALVEPIEGGGRCGSSTALVLRSSGHNDWGSGFGTYEWRAAPQDATASDGNYEGIAFWARNPGPTEKGVLVGFTERQSDSAGGICFGGEMDAGPHVDIPFGDAGAVCEVPLETDPDAGLPPEPGQCGNNFGRTLITSEFWQLHLLPFHTFSQQAQQNRVAAPDISAIYGFGFNVRKDSAVELWIDDISFYRRKPAGL